MTMGRRNGDSDAACWRWPPRPPSRRKCRKSRRAGSARRLAGDAATLEQLYAADFHGIAAGGVRVDRAGLLANLRRNAGGDFIAERECRRAPAR